MTAPGAVPRPPITGAHKALVKILLWARIVWLALRAYGGPRPALAALGAMLRARRVAREGRITRKYILAGGRYHWDLYAPGFPSPAFDHYVERELRRFGPGADPAAPAPQTVILAITRRCPLRCEHCCEWEALNQPEALSRQALIALVEQFQRQVGVAQFFLSGGEPLARFDDLLALLESGGRTSDFWLLTSGVGLGAGRAQRLRRAGLHGVVLSLDHWEPAAHDRFRGFAGAFEAVVKAAGDARQAGLAVALALVPTRGFVSAESLTRYAALAATLGAGFIQLLEPRAVGHYAGREVALDEGQQRLLEEFALRMNFDRSCLSLPAVAYPGALRRQRGCTGAGGRYLYVDTAGLLHPCPFCRLPGPSALPGTGAVDLPAQLRALARGGCPDEAACAARAATRKDPHGGPGASLPVL